MPYRSLFPVRTSAIPISLALVVVAAIPVWAVNAPAQMANKQAMALEAQAEAGESATVMLLNQPGSAENQQIVKLAGRFGLHIIHFNRLAVHWWRKAAKQDYLPAMDQLAFAYYTGKGTEKIYLVAMELWRSAAKRGDAEAQRNLAVCYDDGIGTAADPAKAVLWMKKAAAQGYQMALYYLGNWYDTGHDVQKNRHKARACWKKAAAMGGQVGAEAKAQIAKAAPAKK